MLYWKQPEILFKCSYVEQPSCRMPNVSLGNYMKPSTCQTCQNKKKILIFTVVLLDLWSWTCVTHSLACKNYLPQNKTVWRMSKKPILNQIIPFWLRFRDLQLVLRLLLHCKAHCRKVMLMLEVDIFDVSAYFFFWLDSAKRNANCVNPNEECYLQCNCARGSRGHKFAQNKNRWRT